MRKLKYFIQLDFFNYYFCLIYILFIIKFYNFLFNKLCETDCTSFIPLSNYIINLKTYSYHYSFTFL